MPFNYKIKTESLADWNGKWVENERDAENCSQVEPLFLTNDALQLKRFTGKPGGKPLEANLWEENISEAKDFREQRNDIGKEYTDFLSEAKNLADSHPVEYICLLLDAMRYCPGDSDIRWHVSISEGYILGNRRFELGKFIIAEIGRLWLPKANNTDHVPSLANITVRQLTAKIDVTITNHQSVLPELLKLKKLQVSAGDYFGMILANFFADIFLGLVQVIEDAVGFYSAFNEIKYTIPTIKLLDLVVRIGDPRGEYVLSNFGNGRVLLNLILISGRVEYLDRAIGTCISISRFDNMRAEFAKFLTVNCAYLGALKFGLFCNHLFDFENFVKEHNFTNEQLAEVVAFLEKSDPWWIVGGGAFCRSQLVLFGRILDERGMFSESFKVFYVLAEKNPDVTPQMSELIEWVTSVRKSNNQQNIDHVLKILDQDKFAIAKALDAHMRDETEEAYKLIMEKVIPLDLGGRLTFQELGGFFSEKEYVDRPSFVEDFYNATEKNADKFSKEQWQDAVLESLERTHPNLATKLNALVYPDGAPKRQPMMFSFFPTPLQ